MSDDLAMRFRRRGGALVATFIACYALATPEAAEPSGTQEYIVVKVITAPDKRPWHGKGNLRPWEERQTNNADGSTTVRMSNSCGFVEITYAGMSLERYLSARHFEPSPELVVASMSEWCTVGGLLYEEETLLK